jgi:hypothetical protein
MALIGPGSEWLWTAVSGIVLAVTFLAIYRQLRLQSSQSAIGQLEAFEQEWASERVLRYCVAIQVALRDGVDPAHIPYAPAYAVGAFWGKVGYLTRSGRLDAKLLWNGSGDECPLWWANLAPLARRRRTENGMTLFFKDFEWLASLMAEMNRRAGGPTPNEAWLASWQERSRALAEDMIRVEEALRTVVVASPDALIVGQPPAAPPATQA